MKKRLFLALCLVLVVALTAIPAMAAGSVDAWLSADTTSITPGSTVNVTVSAEVDNCGSGGISVSFDSAVFELTGGSCLLSGTDLSYFDASTKDGAFAYSGSSAISGDVFQFSLKVKDSAPAGSYTVSVTFLADGTSDSSSVTLSMACDHSYTNDCDEECNTCGATRETEHDFGDGKITTAATCGKEGVKTYTCGICGATKTEETDTLDHNFTVIGYAPASCEERGEMEFLCADCGYTYDDYIEAKGHSYDFDCDEECNTCGATRETEHDFGDTWFTDKTSHYQQCNICGLAQEPAPHVPGPEANETEDQVCLTCGFVLEPAGRHIHKAVGNFLSNDTQHWYLCSCGELMGENAHHWFDQGIADGQQTFKCLICSRLKTEPVETTAPVTQPTEMTTEAPAETTTPVVEPVDHVGIPGLAILIPLAIVGLAIVGAVCYVVIGLILGYRKKGKFDAKRKAAPVETVAEEPMDEPQEESLEEPVATEE